MNTTTTNQTTEDIYTIRKLKAVWSAMIQRCNATAWVNYQSYGGRGITVCSEWAADKDAFVAWALANGYQGGLTLDRIDNDGNYHQNNCRFISRKQQQSNRRVTMYLTYYGRTLPAAQLFDELEFDRTTVNRVMMRIHKGWSVEKALEQPYTTQYRRTKSKIDYQGRKWGIKELARHLGKDETEYHRAVGRICIGWDPLLALTLPKRAKQKNAAQFQR